MSIQDYARPQAPPVPEEELEKLYERVESSQRRETRRAQFATRLMFWICGLEALMIIGLTVALIFALPLIRVVHVLIYTKADGTIDYSVTPQGLPPSLSEALKINAGWSYIRLREGYSQVEYTYAWNVVSAMSSDSVRQQYQAENDASNKNASINKLGANVISHVDYISATKACETCDNLYNFRFQRTTKVQGQAEPAISTWVVTVGWTTDLASKIDWRQRIAFNAPGIIITAYPGAQREDIPR